MNKRNPIRHFYTIELPTTKRRVSVSKSDFFFLVTTQRNNVGEVKYTTIYSDRTDADGERYISYTHNLEAI